MSSIEQRTHEHVEALRSSVWGHGYRRLPFPVKLHLLLSCQRLSEIWWTPGGESFAVDRQGFKKHIMSVFFNEKKFHSFQTSLHKYGFRMVTSFNDTTDPENPIDIIVYHHEHFIEDDLELSKTITRVKKTCRKKLHSVTPELKQPTHAPLPLVTNSSDEEDDLIALANEVAGDDPYEDAIFLEKDCSICGDRVMEQNVEDDASDKERENTIET